MSLLEGQFGHVLNGKMVVPDGAKMLDVINPATEEVIVSVPIADQSILDEAVANGRKAFPGWAATSWDDRASAIRKWGDAYRKQIPGLCELLTIEQGAYKLQCQDGLCQNQSLV